MDRPEQHNTTLPWYVNHTLPEDERRKTAALLEASPQAKRELAEWQRIGEVARTEGEQLAPPSDLILKGVMARIKTEAAPLANVTPLPGVSLEAAEPEGVTRQQSKPHWRAWRHWLPAAAAVAAFALLLGDHLQLRQQNAQDQQVYSDLQSELGQLNDVLNMQAQAGSFENHALKPPIRGDENTVVLAASQPWLFLNFDLNPSKTFDSFQGRLIKRADNQVLTQFDGLAYRPNETFLKIRLKFPAVVLDPGSYAIEISGKTPGSEPQLVETYYFKIERP